ncbi:MAG: QcrA and Rieske domain-containing protein [Candidatus Dormibacteria bacterium]
MTPERRVDRFVESLMGNRRPRRFRADPAELEALEMAGRVRGARSGADLPGEEYLESLRRRLAQDLEGAPGGPRRAISRRNLLVAGGAAAAAAIAGGLVGRQTDPEPAIEPELVPANAEWVPAVALADLPPGRVVPFSLGAIDGFIYNRQGTVMAVSAICTHLACKLNLSASGQRLDCPCHATSFTPDGQVAGHNLDYAPRPLPRIRTRLRDGKVEVLVARLDATPAQTSW